MKNFIAESMKILIDIMLISNDQSTNIKNPRF